MLDRIDLHVSVQRPKYTELTATRAEESSEVIRARVKLARERQAKRLAIYGMRTNSQMQHRQIKETCGMTPRAQQILADVFNRLHLSARAYDRIIKVSRTIADLQGKDIIDAEQIAEAVSYRAQDKE